jgi:hypothetical protein
MTSRYSTDLLNVRTSVAFVQGRIGLDALGGSKIPEREVGEARGLSRETAFIRM